MNIIAVIKYKSFDGELECFNVNEHRKHTTLAELKEVGSNEYTLFFKFMKRFIMKAIDEKVSKIQVTIRVGEEIMYFQLFEGKEPLVIVDGKEIRLEHNNHLVKHVLMTFCNKYGIVNK